MVLRQELTSKPNALNISWWRSENHEWNSNTYKRKQETDQEEWTDKQEDKKLQFPPGLQILL